MSLRVELTPKERAHHESTRVQHVNADLMGFCSWCKRGIPYGYSPIVTSYAVQTWGTGTQAFRVSIPVDLWCLPCGQRAQKAGTLPKVKFDRSGNYVRPTQAQIRAKAQDPNMKSEEQEEQEEQETDEVTPELTAREVADKLWEIMSEEESEAHGSKKLAEMAGIPDEAPRVLQVLKVLRNSGKVTFKDGKWFKA